MTKTKWTADDIPDQTGRTILVTGANSGLGFQTSRQLATHGAHVVLACRNTDKGTEAKDLITAEHPGASLELLRLDLASLVSIREAAAAFVGGHDRIDVLVNNAGVMGIPHRTTDDGFEMQFGTNHLGHFALTGLLLERLLSTAGSRVVTVSSTAHRFGSMDFDDPMGQTRYRKWPAYGQSKLANLLFTLELQRRLDAAGAGTIAVAAHPGYAATNLQTTGPKMAGSRIAERGSTMMNKVMAQSDEMGALPQLHAATAPDVQGGDYFGPDGFMEQRGHPKKAKRTGKAQRDADARRLWDLSEELTGVTYDALASP